MSIGISTVELTRAQLDLLAKKLGRLILGVASGHVSLSDSRRATLAAALVLIGLLLLLLLYARLRLGYGVARDSQRTLADRRVVNEPDLSGRESFAAHQECDLVAGRCDQVRDRFVRQAVRFGAVYLQYCVACS